MKSIAVLVAACLMLSACGQPLTVVDDSGKSKTYPTYGVFNESTSRSNKVCYSVSVGNVIWSIILIETLIAPIYFVGWSIQNPIRLKKSPTDDCSFDA